jgi:hypothetical protein
MWRMMPEMSREFDSEEALISPWGEAPPDKFIKHGSVSPGQLFRVSVSGAKLDSNVSRLCAEFPESLSERVEEMRIGV